MAADSSTVPTTTSNHSNERNTVADSNHVNGESHDRPKHHDSAIDANVLPLCGEKNKWREGTKVVTEVQRSELLWCRKIEDATPIPGRPRRCRRRLRRYHRYSSTKSGKVRIERLDGSTRPIMGASPRVHSPQATLWTTKVSRRNADSIPGAISVRGPDADNGNHATSNTHRTRRTLSNPAHQDVEDDSSFEQSDDDQETSIVDGDVDNDSSVEDNEEDAESVTGQQASTLREPSTNNVVTTAIHVLDEGTADMRLEEEVNARLNKVLQEMTVAVPIVVDDNAVPESTSSAEKSATLQNWWRVQSTWSKVAAVTVLLLLMAIVVGGMIYALLLETGEGVNTSSRDFSTSTDDDGEFDDVLSDTGTSVFGLTTEGGQRGLSALGTWLTLTFLPDTHHEFELDGVAAYRTNDDEDCWLWRKSPSSKSHDEGLDPSPRRSQSLRGSTKYARTWHC